MARHVPLDSVDHTGLRVRTEHRPGLGDDAMFAAVYPHEFRNLQAHYPLVFVKEAASGGFRPVALFGLEPASNLFLCASGWDAPAIPASVRMRPFLIGRSAGGFAVHIDLDHPRVSGSEGELLFLPHGEHSPLLRRAAELLNEVRDAEAALPRFVALLTELALLEPFTLDVTLNDGVSGRLAGYYTIAEETLRALDGAALGRLHAAGALEPVFMAVASLSNFIALIARRNARIGAAA